MKMKALFMFCHLADGELLRHRKDISGLAYISGTCHMIMVVRLLSRFSQSLLWAAIRK